MARHRFESVDSISPDANSFNGKDLRLMGRLAEKVKDIVEVRPFAQLSDFQADPTLTLSSYHFTDITAVLMAKWIDSIAEARPADGRALALAGFRGVGKSHFMAAIAVVISRPELRAKVLDPHVLSSVERLGRRPITVVSIRRGAGTSLLDEFKRAIGETLGLKPATLSDSLDELLLLMTQHSPDGPSVLLVDTALGRGSRVTRDDGPVLAEIAAASQRLGVFLGLALDDDISGADGPNSSIAQAFRIDYLDQEHLYKIVESHIFTKLGDKLPVLKDIYRFYREVLPGFRWSEQRFSSLYPLHPATVEVAPLIRLHLHDFALLGFAAEAGVRIMGRPANSLIGLDEIFDSVESRLRSVEDLAAAFAAYDRLEREVIAKINVQIRLPAKLILKGLFVLSLSGTGSTASEIAAAMMIFHEGDARPAVDVSGLLDSFAQALPDNIRVTTDAGEPKFSIRLSQSAELDDLLGDVAHSVSEQVIHEVLIRRFWERYGTIGDGKGYIESDIVWRGGVRRTAVYTGESSETAAILDHVISISFDSGSLSDGMVWRPAKVEPNESETLARYSLLHSDGAIRAKLGDGLRAALDIHSLAVDKITQRVFFTDAAVEAGDDILRFSADAGSGQELSQVLASMFEGYWERLYPSHPLFKDALDSTAATELIANFFGGADIGGVETQRQAEIFAAPLGLAVLSGDRFVVAEPDLLACLEPVKVVLNSLASQSVSLEDAYRSLAARPFGFTRETSKVILATLVSQRLIEFVTTSGNRITHRSLDLQIVWEDVTAVSKPQSGRRSSERLARWARIATGNAGIKSIERSADRSLIHDSLTGWRTGWNEDHVLLDFDLLPDESLSASIWRTAGGVRKSFGAMAEVVERLAAGDADLEEALNAIADIFSDSETEFEKKRADLRIVREHTVKAARRKEIIEYLAVSELTQEKNVEMLRRRLLDSIGMDSEIGTSTMENLWPTFKLAYSDFYAARHNEIMANPARDEKVRNILSSAKWSLLSAVLRTDILPTRVKADFVDLLREIRQGACTVDLNEALSRRPTCGCRFNLRDREWLIAQPDQLAAAIAGAVTVIRDRVLDLEGDNNSGSFARLAAKLEYDSPMTAEEILMVIRAVQNKSRTVLHPGIEAAAAEWLPVPSNSEVFATVET